MGTVIIIGAGISGLTTAYALRQRGHEVTVLDRQEHPGGCIRSERISGFLMEHGPNSMIAPAPAPEKLIGELGLSRQRINRSTAVRYRYLVRRGGIHRLSLQPLRFFLSNFFSLRGRLRILIEPLIPAQNRTDESVADFVRRRFGREFLDYVMNPLVGGLYAGNPEKLSVAAVFPALKRLEHDFGSVIGGIIRSRQRRQQNNKHYHPANRMLFSFRQGLETLPCALAQHLAGNIFVGYRVHKIYRQAGGGFRIKARCGKETVSLTGDSVVFALPAYAAAPMLQGLNPGLTDILSEIAHPPLSVVFLGYRSHAIMHPLDGLGVLAPEIERRNVLGILFSSTLFAGRAPEGHVALTAFVGGTRQADLACLGQDDLQDLVHSEVQDLLGARARPVLARTRYWKYALPQLNVGHAERISKIREIETEQSGLFLTGNYITGVSTTACMEQAFATAQRVHSYLVDSQTVHMVPWHGHLPTRESAGVLGSKGIADWGASPGVAAKKQTPSTRQVLYL